jgi:predicted DCC family thiol-disulfide oxidoreductase YuxK
MSPAGRTAAPPVVVYNGSCPICSREIAGYRRLAARHGVALGWLDAAAPDAALAPLGLDPDRAARRLHVLEDGRLLAGVEAFLALWRRLPGWRHLARLVALPGLRGPAELVYEGLLAPALHAWHRRRLSRHRSACR